MERPSGPLNHLRPFKFNVLTIQHRALCSHLRVLVWGPHLAICIGVGATYDREDDSNG